MDKYTAPVSGRPAFVYALAHPETGEVRYIGRTVRPLKVRLARHLKEAETGDRRHVSCWIVGLPAIPTIHVLATVPEEMAAYAERDLIAVLRDNGTRLTNLTEGGEGSHGFRHSPESRAKISAARKGKHVSPEIAARLKAMRQSAEHRAKLSRAHKGKSPSAENRAKVSEGVRRSWAIGPRRQAFLARKRSQNQPELF